MRPLIGIDLGGTKIEVAVLAPDGRWALRERRATPQGDYAGTLAAIATLVGLADGAALRWTSERLPVGVAIPGSVSPATGLLRNANSTVLNGQRLLDDLAGVLERPVRIENDANCLAASEAVDGAARGAALTFAVILGTGVGAGLAWGGRVWTGPNAVGGEWGHNPLPWPRADWQETAAPTCWCGRPGCIETWLSGPAWARDHVRLGGDDVPAPDIVARMRRGDRLASRSFDRYADRLARSLAHVINVLDPAHIVLGGGLSQVDELYEQVPRRWARHVFSDTITTPLSRALHGDSSGVRGAAWLWRD